MIPVNWAFAAEEFHKALEHWPAIGIHLIHPSTDSLHRTGEDFQRFGFETIHILLRTTPANGF